MVSHGNGSRGPKRVQTELFPMGMERRQGGRPTNEERGLPPSTSHTPRREIRASEPVLVTIRLVDGLPKLRREDEWKVLQGCFQAMMAREGLRLCHYSVMDDHLHLIFEADDRSALARGMQSLQIRMARRLNKLWGRRGRTFNDRYFETILDTPELVRLALSYVLNNARRHQVGPIAKLDRFASGGWFDGWRERDRVGTWPEDERLVDKPETWLLREGWRKQEGRADPHPGLDVQEIPKSL